MLAFLQEVEQQVLEFPRYEYLCLRMTGMTHKKVSELYDFGIVLKSLAGCLGIVEFYLQKYSTVGMREFVA